MVLFDTILDFQYTHAITFLLPILCPDSVTSVLAGQHAPTTAATPCARHRAEFL